jgi:hypothetical protein
MALTLSYISLSLMALKKAKLLPDTGSSGGMRGKYRLTYLCGFLLLYRYSPIASLMGII